MKNRKLLYCFVSMLFISLTGCEPKTFTFNFTNYIEPINIHTDLQNQFLNDNSYMTSSMTAYSDPNSERSHPKPFRLKWDINIDTHKKPASYDVIINKEGSTDFINYSSSSNSFDLYNLEVGVKYEYKIYANYKKNRYESEIGSFEVENTWPRNLKVDGVTNVRDLGNVGNIKQGRLFRSGEFNDHSSETYTSFLTNSSLFTLNNVLKIKSEIDLRAASENGKQSECAFNQNNNYFNLPMKYGGPVQVINYKDNEIDNLASVKSFFEILSNKDNFPVVYHCSFGKDRTGYLSYLVGALCDGSQEEIYRDYLFSNFGTVSSVSVKTLDGTKAYPYLIDNCSGDTLKEKVITYLTLDDDKHPGLSLDTLNAVISNLCE